MSGPSSEQVSFNIVKGLPPADRRLVRSWVDRTGCDWTTALLNSGVLGSRYRRTPEQEARAAARAEADEAMEQWLQLVSPPDEISRRREASEHESAHAIIGEALGATVSFAALGADGGGACRITAAGLTDLQRATFWLGPMLWINRFRSMQFPRGATGCAQDRRDAAATGADLDQATKLAVRILAENCDAVIALADKIDTDGYYLGPTAG